MSDTTQAVIYTMKVKSEHSEAFLSASILEAQGVVSEEPGVFQFHFLQDESDPNRFYFFQVFRDETAIKAHWDTEVFKTWWNTIEPMLDGEMETVAKMRPLFPSEKGFAAQKPGLLMW